MTAIDDENDVIVELARHNGRLRPATAGRRTLEIGSDVEIAGRVGEDLRRAWGEVVYAEGQFWRYQSTHWAQIPDAELRRAVHEFDGASYRTPASGAAQVKLGRGRIDSVLNELAAMTARPDFFDNGATGINCVSGFIRFAADGKPSLEPHDREHRRRHTLPGRWSPGTIGTPPPSSLLARLLDGVFYGDADAGEKTALLAEIVGAAALGYATRLRQPRAVILKGETAENGKSQILDLARGLLPPSAVCSITAARMGDERHIVGLAGKLLNASDELSAAAAISSDTFKAVVTGEPVEGRDVYKSRIEFRPIAQHLFATNTLPPFAGGMDRGVQRRLLVIQFNRVIPIEERIEAIGRRIAEEEADLLLAWAVAGAARLIRRRDFAIPDTSKAALQDWLYGADPVLAWLAECVETSPIVGDEPKVRTSYVHQQFRAWAETAGFRRDTLPAVNGFVQRVRANTEGIEYRRRSDGPVFVGMAIRHFPVTHQ